MKCTSLSARIAVNKIVSWLSDYLKMSNQKGFVVGVSGGVDSAVVSTLCALTGKPTLCLTLPIHQNPDHVSRAAEQVSWLVSQFPNVEFLDIDLTPAFESFKECMMGEAEELKSVTPQELTRVELALANARSRLRMMTLYNFSNLKQYLVVGTGNKIEDYGVGFCTIGGDAQVDISPIGDLLKTQVWEVAKHLGIPESIQKAIPSDGLWDNSRSDEDQIGSSYLELEVAYKICRAMGIETKAQVKNLKNKGWWPVLTDRENVVLDIYLDRHEKNAHKMRTPPVCKVELEARPFQSRNIRINSQAGA